MCAKHPDPALHTPRPSLAQTGISPLISAVHDQLQAPQIPNKQNPWFGYFATLKWPTIFCPVCNTLHHGSHVTNSCQVSQIWIASGLDISSCCARPSQTNHCESFKVMLWGVTCNQSGLGTSCSELYSLPGSSSFTYIWCHLSLLKPQTALLFGAGGSLMDGGLEWAFLICSFALHPGTSLPPRVSRNNLNPSFGPWVAYKYTSPAIKLFWGPPAPKCTSP